MERTFRRQCPQCVNLVTWPDTPTYPFCSERCRLIDLGLWARGDYRIPSRESGDEGVCSEEASRDIEDGFC